MLLPLHLNLDDDDETPSIPRIGCVHATAILAGTVVATAALLADVTATVSLAGTVTAAASLQHDVQSTATLAATVTASAQKC